MSLLARIKTLVCRFTCLIEFCHRCGVRQPLVWWCESDPLWREVTGCDVGGIYCPRCFDALARRKGIAVRWLATEDYRFTKADA